MDKIILRKAWIEALRSGKYEQGKRNLNHNNKFCCLGVACEVYIQQGGDLKVNRGFGVPSEYNQNAAGMPEVAQRAFGLHDSLGFPKENTNCWFGLASLNDNGTSFAEIADILEQHPERYFVDDE